MSGLLTIRSGVDFDDAEYGVKEEDKPERKVFKSNSFIRRSADHRRNGTSKC